MFSVFLFLNMDWGNVLALGTTCVTNTWLLWLFEFGTHPIYILEPVRAGPCMCAARV